MLLLGIQYFFSFLGGVFTFVAFAGVACFLCSSSCLELSPSSVSACSSLLGNVHLMCCFWGVAVQTLERLLWSCGSVTRCRYNCRCIVTSFFLKCKRENVCSAAAGFYKMIHQITLVLCEPLICNASIASGTLLPLTLFLSYYWKSHTWNTLSLCHTCCSPRWHLLQLKKEHVYMTALSYRDTK